MIILLDLNYTLVENSAETFSLQHGPDIRRETYRQWLVNLLRPHPVVLVTVRLESLRAATLDNILAQTGWQPAMSCFKPDAWRYMPAPQWKQRAFLETVRPHYGQETPYMALESNSQTRLMYTALNIPAFKVPRRPLQGLPELPAHG